MRVPRKFATPRKKEDRVAEAVSDGRRAEHAVIAADARAGRAL